MFNDDQTNALRRLLELDQQAIERGEGRDIAEFFVEFDTDENIGVRLGESPQGSS